jgi:DnaJ-class molecular chaperone
MVNHPDKNKNDPEKTAKFQKISEAYEILGDEEKKKEYDMTKNNPFFNMMGPGGGSGPNMGFPVDELFSQLFGMHGMPFQNMGSFGPGVGPNIRVFHNGMPVHIGLQKPTPIIKNIDVPIDKILTGTTIPLEIERWIMENGNKIFENETVYVTVPKGIDEGEIIILRDKGNVAREDCKGDIKIFIKINNDTEFKRSGLDLILEKTITVKEALCGFAFELKYITGKTYTITNNSGNIISHGYRKMIPNMGFSREGHVGNLIIVFNISFPENILPEVLEQLKNLNF